MKASRFVVIDDVLLKKSATGLLQRCLNEEEAGQILRDIHEGECGNHSSGRNMSCKVLRMGYYWPTVKSFQASKIKGGHFERNILCKFGVSFEIVCDNGSQFLSDKTEVFCQRWNITLTKSTPRYPQANGQAESSNNIIINNLKIRLSSHKGRWVEQLPWVSWSDMTTLKTSMGQTPFSLVYGTETVLPTEILTPTARYGLLTVESNHDELMHDLNTVGELHDMAKL
ncbi:uncharacterized protein LOC141705881 [Apium graveolens]|uniref:uncharacterized protein LOC141705881 n=1 Tax=Apium graveolens TaxID=4045 RepID=UPI003D7A188C